VTIGARDDPAFSYDFGQIEAVAHDLGLDTVKAQPSADGLAKAIEQLAARGRSDIAIFLGGHGYAAIGEGQSYTDAKGGVITEPEYRNPTINLKDNGSSAPASITATGLARILGRFPKLTFKVIVDSCHSGRFLDPLAALANVAIVLTSTDARHYAYVGFGDAIAKSLRTWAASPGTTKLAEALREALSSDPMKSWVASAPNDLHPQVSPPRTGPIASRCGTAQSLLFDNWNGDPVAGGGTPPSFGTAGKAYCVVSISTYHWNDGSGAGPGTIALEAGAGAALGPWKASGSSGQNAAPNVNWTATPGSAAKPVVIDGTYTCRGSDPASWSQNAASGGHGFCKVTVEPASAG